MPSVDKHTQTVIVLDANGNVVSFGASGTSMADNAAFTPGTTPGTPALFEVDDTSTSLATEGSAGIARMTTSRIIMVGGDVAHDGVDAGLPLKIGGYASTTPPTSVAAGDRVNSWMGLQGQTIIGGNASAGADGVNAIHFPDSASTTRPGLALAMFNGTNHDRVRGTAANGLETNLKTINGTAPATGSGNATGALRVELPTNGTGIVGLAAGTNAIGKLAANSGVDIGDVDVTSISAGANLIGDVGIQPRTTNGLTTFMASGSDGSSILVATAQVIKASAGKLYGYYIYNPEAAVTFVHFYNTAAASVTVGTTNPLFTIPVPAGSAANLLNDIGITFSNAGWSCAATTTAGGNTAPSTGVSLVAWYA